MACAHCARCPAVDRWHPPVRRCSLCPRPDCDLAKAPSTRLACWRGVCRVARAFGRLLFGPGGWAAFGLVALVSVVAGVATIWSAWAHKP